MNEPAHEARDTECVRVRLRGYILSIIFVPILVVARVDKDRNDDRAKDRDLTRIETEAGAKIAMGTELKSVENVCNTYPGEVRRLFEALDLERPGLATVQKALADGDTAAACSELLAYYRRCASGGWLRREPPKPGEGRDEAGDALLADQFTFFGKTAPLRRKADGRIDWEDRGPDKDVEWAYQVNRHQHLAMLLAAFARTGNRIYADGIDNQIRDWMSAALPYPNRKTASPLWRGLEVVGRAKSWVRIFYGLQDVDALQPGTRLLMLVSLVDHAHYLRNFHKRGGNWITMEMTGLATIAAAWPEFAKSRAWLDYAGTRLTEELTLQVYPDGVQTELTAGYHMVALVNFMQFARIFEHAGRELPRRYAGTLQRMWNYTAFSMRPDGGGPLNNDSDRKMYRPRVLRAEQQYDRPDWLFIATNGEKGKEPEGPPSVVFPWAGQLIMRSGYDRTAHWAFFDFGPWGTSHQHQDKLHLSIHAYGRDLLVDSGRFGYAGTIATKFRRAYATHAAGHNVILIDGQNQNEWNRKAKQPAAESEYAVTDNFDFARGSIDRFQMFKGKARHTRSVVYVRGGFWVVADRIETDRPRRLQALWHWHPDCTVRAGDGRVESEDPDKGNLAIVPAGEVRWNVQLAKGQEKPRLQGWYSDNYNTFTPAPAAVYSAKIQADATFAWVLVPAKGVVPPVEVTLLENTPDSVSVQVLIGDERRVVCVPFTNGAVPAVTRAER